MTERESALGVLERLVEETGMIRVLPVTARGKAVYFALLIVMSAVIGISLTPGLPIRIPVYEAGEPAREALQAPEDMTLEDEVTTRLRRSEAARMVPAIYDYDEGVVSEVVRRLGEFFESMRQHVSVESSRTDAEKAASLGLALHPRTLAELRAIRWPEVVEIQIKRAAEQLLKPGVIGSMGDLPAESGVAIMIRRVPGGQEFTESSYDYITDLRGARSAAPGIIDLWMEESPLRLRQAATELLREVLRPNFSRNIQETERRRLKAGESVKPVYVRITKGELIIREGERVDQQKLDLLDLIRARQKESRWLLHFAALTIAVFVFLFALVFYLRRQFVSVASEPYDLLTMGILLTVVTVINRLLPPIWIYVALVAPFAVVLRLIYRAETVFAWTVVASVLSVIAAHGDLVLAIHYLAAGSVGTALISQTTSRGIVMRTGAAIGLINASAVLVVWQMGSIDSGQLREALLIAIAGGALATPTCVYVILPSLERLFNYTSDLRLMELNTFDHPLIQKVFLQSPGTYHHSLIVGALSEAGVKEIGGNALLARVACMYHDIGKSLKPSFFVENLVEGQTNPHLKLSPTMSALVIRSHVEEGIRMGHEAGLPQAVIDMIPQHHGTKLMKFFYRKAIDQRDPDAPAINDADFRYPGPKPQTREAGVILLADACEAAARTLPDYTRARIQGMVQKLINDAFADGQLDECELTLKDLHVIARTFTRVIGAFYHHRIKYPEPAEKVRAKIPDPDVTDLDDGGREDDGASAEKPDGGRPDDLKRLGI
ncbi:MAG: HDIG domain-containing protein [Deltaproteobacteria bacterium]|nr:HDIG domain-containing protein [Deltaproteobacteria bacterium]